MKWQLKIVLSLCVVALTAYVTVPFWLGRVLAPQLPDGWHLQTLDADYPGMTAIRIRTLRISGSETGSKFSLTARDVLVGYRSLQIDIDEAWLDLNVPAAAKPIASISPEDISLPVITLAPSLPQMRVNELHLRVVSGASRPVVLDLQSLAIVPHSGDTFRLEAHVNMAGLTTGTGHFAVDVAPGRLDATLRIPASLRSPAWLEAGFQQGIDDALSTSRVLLSIDTGNTDQAWFDQLASQLSAGTLQHLGGTLEVQGIFSGEGRQFLQDLSISAHDVKTRLGEASLMQRFLPGFHLQHKDVSEAVADIVVQVRPGESLPRPSSQQITTGFDTDIHIDYASETQAISLQTSSFHLGEIDTSEWSPATATGKIVLDWKLKKPFTWSEGDQSIASNQLRVTTTLKVADGQISSTGTAKLKDVQAPLFDASAETIDLGWNNLDVLNQTGELSTRSTGLAVRNGDETWTGLDFDVSYHRSGNDNVSGHGHLLLDDNPVLPLEFGGNLQTSHWYVSLPKTRIDVQQALRLLSRVHVQQPDMFVIRSGDMDVRADIEAAATLSANASVQGQRFSLSVQESTAREGQFTLNLNYAANEAGSSWSLDGPVSVADLALAGGLDLHQMGAQIAVRAESPDDPTVTVSSLEAQLLGGEMYLPQLKISSQGLEDTQVHLRSIDLGRLLAIADIDGLEGSGTLEISLPLGRDQDGFHIIDGEFHSTGGGRLAYKKEGMPGVNIGLQALENFEFQSLSGNLNYQSDGNYRIAVRLQGSNPDLYAGHPIVFNLDINGTLPKLFEAFFISGDFEKAVLHQIEQY